MPDIVCPGCSRVTQLVAVRRAADEFCSHCDYPLFWAPTAVPMATPGASNLATLRRLPGAGGRQRVGSKVCPECGELNPLADVLHPLHRRPRPEAGTSAGSRARAGGARGAAGAAATRTPVVVAVGCHRRRGRRRGRAARRRDRHQLTAAGRSRVSRTGRLRSRAPSPFGAVRCRAPARRRGGHGSGTGRRC